MLWRSGEVHQSGFASEVVRQCMPLKRWPVLWADGDEHRSQRTKVARYFAPKVVDTRYRELIETRADAFLARLDAGEAVDMSELTLHFSAQVAAQVIGLTDSDQEAMARRLVGFFDQPAAVLEPGASGWRRLLSLPAAPPGSVDLLRLEPVVGHLLRRAVVDVHLTTDEGEVTIPAGDRLDLYIRSANADPAIGEDGLRLCPARGLVLRQGVRS